jgi:putative transposase
VILLGERSLRRALNEFVEHYHAERNHRGKGNVLLFPGDTHVRREGPLKCRERLGGLLRLYEAPRVKGVFRRVSQILLRRRLPT